MQKSPLNPKELGFYITISQIGLEMVAPLVLGLVLDYNLGWAPWGAVVGAALGFVTGVGHLISLLNQHQDSGSSKPPRDTP
jgi:F0F1-type ATP synthase assembly protein I